PAFTLASGNQVPFTATATFTDATTRDVTEDATWTIDKTNVATFADSQNQPGQVVGVDSGLATLTASFGGKSQNVILTVP
ncbi:MAG TPA: Ig-like domain-containing protein, partial [Geobacteraceae bacterium]|nr:Ig-like domain-containing protein [Geobacteraceae bacterium]